MPTTIITVADATEKEHLLIKRICPYLSLSDVGNTHLYSGELSHILFLFYYGLLTADDEIQNKAVCNLEYHLEIAENHLLNYKFGYGVSGLAWLTQFLVNKGILDADASLSLNDLDFHIHKSLKWNFDDALYDLFIGSMGKGLYFLERLEADINNVLARQALSEIVKNLDEIAVKTDGKLCWLDEYTSGYSDHRPGSPYYGIGLSHGIPSVIIFLCFCVKKNIELKIAARLIEQSCNWLIAQEDGNNRFPSTVYPDGEKSKNTTTLSWCYGILSVAYSCLAAGFTLNNQALQDKAESILGYASSITLEESKVEQNEYGYNIFFCHGTSGISYLFHKAHLLTGVSALKKAADYWFKITVDETKKYPDAELSANNSLLTGSCGVAIVAATRINTNVIAGWDKLLLLNIEDLID
jgi:hypothetical protein